MRAARASAGWLLVVLLSCARAEPPRVPAPAPGGGAAGQVTPPPAGAQPPVPAPAVPARPATPVELPPNPAFDSAVRNGTRTGTGRPGPKYWQQRVSYRIDAELDPRTARVSGDEHIVYVNNSPDTLTSLVLHLYQNLFRAGAPRTESTPTTEGMVLEAVSVDGRAARALRGATGTRPFYQVDNTVMGLGLRRPLAPGDTARLDISWHFTVPPAGAPRMGHEGRSLFEVAQWYPQVAVYDDLGGWDTQPYLGMGEFYLEYGDYDVSITLPEGYLVAATGTLGNPEEVLTASERERLALALRVDTVVHVVGPDDQRPGAMTQQVPGAELTWRFRAHDVRDFAFAASSRYLWDAAHADIDNDGDGKPEAVRVNAFYRPEARTWRRAAAYTRHAIAWGTNYLVPYIYPQVTAVEGPEQGMEYPMLVFVSAYPDSVELADVLVHEVGHEWFPMMVGSNEHRYAWQDEGVNTFVEERSMAALMPGNDVPTQNRDTYLAIAGSGAEVPMMRAADLFGDPASYSIGSYSKPALALRTLQLMLGPEKLRDGLRDYARAWTLRHPDARDFFHTFDALAGQDLAWFWRPWFWGTAVLDQAIATVGDAGDGRVAVTIENKGRLPAPVLLRLTLADARNLDVTVPATVWQGENRRWTENVAAGAIVQRVTIDPDTLLPDVNRGNNVWVRKQ